jgi:hypothetical protein
MFWAGFGSVGLLLICSALAADDSAPGFPALKSTAEPVPAARKMRHYIVQVKLIEVDDQGRESVLGEPRLQTAGGNAGLSIDHPDGRRFEFTIRLTDRLGTNDDLIPARTMARSGEDGVLKKLDQKLELNLQQQSRKDVLREIARRAGISIALDPESSRTIAGEMDTAVNLVAKDEAVGDVLDRLLQPLKLEYHVKDDAVVIARPDRLIPAADEFILKTYDVADLIKSVDESGRESSDFAPLIDRIKTTVQPTTWDRKEAAATIRPFNSTQSIVVRQTSYAHSSIERLLDRIRREQPNLIDD